MNNKSTRYFKYAIGEILLVVIGILLALQINNWNEAKQLQNVEKATLKALLTEFKDNKASVKSYLYGTKEDISFGDTLRNQLGPKLSQLSIDDVNDLIGQIAYTVKVPVSIDVLDDVRTSGKLNLISDEDIRRDISKWSSYLKELQGEQSDWAQEFSNQFIPYTNKWLQWDDIDSILDTDGDKRYYQSRFKVDPRLMLQQPEFANIMAIQYWRFVRVEKRTNDLLIQTDSVISSIEKELH